VNRFGGGVAASTTVFANVILLTFGRILRVLWSLGADAGKPMRSIAKYIIVALLGAGLFAGVDWKYSGPPGTGLRWSNNTEIKPQPSDAYERKVKDTKDIWGNSTVSVYSAPYTAPNAAPLMLKDLSPEGQVRAIDLILKQPKPEAAWQKLMSLLDGDTRARNRVDPYRVDRVLIATVAKGLNTLPGDRILWTRVLIAPINFKFAGYTVAATENKLIKLASIENSTSTKLSIKNGTETLVPVLGKPEVGQEIEKTQKASSDVNEQYENLGVDIKPNFLRIIRESAPGGDVAGNTTIQLSILTDPSIIRCESGNQRKCPPNPAAKALPTANDETDPDGNLELVVDSTSLENGEQDPRIDVLPQSALPHCPLKAQVWMLYESRNIISGRGNLLEGLQKVELRQDVFDAGTVDIVPADDIAPAVWSIKVTDARAKEPVTDDAPDLFAQINKGSARKLAFTNYLTASELVHWLKTQMAAGTRGEPSLQKMTFHVDSSKTLTPFKHITDDCQPKSKMATNR
jgi:hypothetical protein